MIQFQLREDDVEIAGRAVAAWHGSAADDEPLMWHITVELAAGDARLTRADGTVNALNRIDCRVTPVAPFRDLSSAGELLGNLAGQSVRLSGSWGDLSNDAIPVGTVVWPVTWVVADLGITPLVEEHGFTQAVRDLDVFAFTDDCQLSPEAVLPPHHRQDRHVEVSLPFPFRPQPTAVPQFVDCRDREDREQQLYFGRPNPRPAFPLYDDRQHLYTVASTPTSDTLSVTIDTGDPGAGKGFFYAKLALTHDEGFETMCVPNVCLVDPGRSCQATGEERYTYVWPTFPSARPGDLVLGPAGPGGVLGRLLGALDPPQRYDHMGMFVENDGATIRHCTASDDRIQDPEYYNGEVTVTTPFGTMSEKVPLKGIREDVLRYGWPGSITQSVGEVMISGRNRSNPQFGHAALYPAVTADEAANPPKLWQLAPAERDKRTSFHDPEAAGTAKHGHDGGARRRYSLVRLQKDPAWRPEIDPDTGRPIGWLWPVIVQPHPFLKPTAYEALAVVAAQAKVLRAHYRFFAYTKGDIAMNPSFDAPGPGAWGPGEGRDWAAGSIAAVCSSFAWAAVQAANPILGGAGGNPIELEGEPEPSDRRVPGAADGLYRYKADERVDAGKALNEYTYHRVAAEVQKKVDDLPGAVTTLMDVLGLFAGSSPTDQVKDYLATTVANQLCNIFASDAAGDFQETWAHAGEGSAVSPDDTMLRWDPNADLTTYPPTSPVRVNVYGNPIPVAVPRPGWRREPVYRVKAVTGIGSISGLVVRRERPDQNPQRVVGATVRFGCRTVSTDAEGSFRFSNVKAGAYHLQGSMFVVDEETRVGTEWTSKPDLLKLRPGDDIGGIELELVPPPGVARDVMVQSHHDVVDRRVVGKDAWGHFDLDGTIELAHDPLDVPGAPADQRNTRLSGGFDRTTPEVGSGVHVRVQVAARLKQTPGPAGSVSYDGTVIADLTVVFFDAEEGETNATRTELGIELAPGATHPMPFNLVSDDTVPERASGHLTVSNVFAVLA
ncbi:MAG TPA: hypothetical protein VES01_06390 [Dermatophilaceae bacterium]|nr:hypothetical protein [Dermatophilaceae bacterium]